MDGYTVTVEAAARQPGGWPVGAFEEFAELMLGWDGAVSSGREHERYGATFSVDALVVDDAVRAGLSTFRSLAEKAGLPAWPIVQVEVMTYAEHDAELARPAVPELVGTSEIAELLAVSRQRAHQLAKSDAFPEPVQELSAGPVWARTSLDRFVEGWDRRPGRPAREEPAKVLDLMAALEASLERAGSGSSTSSEALLSATDVASVFDVTSRTVSNWVQSGRLHPSKYSGGRHRVFDADEVARFAAEILAAADLSGMRAVPRTGDAPTDAEKMRSS